MEIIEVDQLGFEQIIAEPYLVFGSANFAFLNRNKVEKVYYLLFRDEKYRLGIIGGIINGSFYSPFSAPFGGFIFLSEDVKISQIDSALELLIEWSKNNNIKRIRLVLPPAIYNESFIAKQSNSLFRKGFIVENIDLNYSFKTDCFPENYSDCIWRNARKNLNVAMKNNLSFHLCQGNVEKQIAYDIIKKNRETKGYPLKMSWNQIVETTAILPSDFFICRDQQGVLVASAIIFNVAKDIVQVIYWGDISEFSHLKTMNFLAYKVFEYYKGQGHRIVDIGPSTENSIPNFGLCEFKESIGCEVSQKMTFLKDL